MRDAIRKDSTRKEYSPSSGEGPTLTPQVESMPVQFQGMEIHQRGASSGSGLTVIDAHPLVLSRSDQGIHSTHASHTQTRALARKRFIYKGSRFSRKVISGKHYHGCVVYSGLTASSSSDFSAWRF